MYLLLHREDTEKRFQKILALRSFFPVKCEVCLVWRMLRLVKLPTDATNDGWVVTGVSLVLASFLLAFDSTDYLSM